MSKKSNLSKIGLFQLHRNNNVDIVNKYKNIHQEHTAKNIHLCAYSLYLEKYVNNTTLEMKEKAKPLMTCKNKFCANCTYLKSRKVLQQTIKVMEYINNNDIKYVPYHLTLTIKNPSVDDFEKTLKTINNAFRLMFKKTSKYKFKNFVLGYQASRETTQSQDAKQRNELHPHIHVLLLLDQKFYNAKSRSSKLTKIDILKEWNLCLRHYDSNFPESTQIDFKQIKTDKTNDANLQINAIAEVSKYPVKLGDLTKMSDQHFELLDSVLFNKRLMTFGGIIKDARHKLSLVDEEVGEDDINVFSANEVEEYTLSFVELYKVRKQKYKKVEVDKMRFKDKLNYNLLTKTNFFDVSKDLKKQEENLQRLNFESMIEDFKLACYKKAKCENKKIEFFDENHCPVFYENGKYIPHLNYLHDIENY